MIYWNLESFGYPNWVPVSQLEMDILYRGAKDFHKDHSQEHIRQLIDATRAQLQREADNGIVDPTWVSTAIMVIALSGIAGDKLPEHTWEPL